VLPLRELVELFLGRDFPNTVLTSLRASIICLLRLNMVSSSVFDILHHEGDLTHIALNVNQIKKTNKSLSSGCSIFLEQILQYNIH